MPRSLEDQISRFEELLAEMDEATRKGHEFLKDLKNERKEAEKLWDNGEIKGMVRKQVEKTVTSELEKIRPTIGKQTDRIYERVDDQISKVIDLCLGREFAAKQGHKDIRPQLAEKLREWIREIIDEEEQS